MENPQGQKEIQETIRINTHKRRGKYQVITFNPFTRKKKTHKEPNSHRKMQITRQVRLMPAFNNPTTPR